METVKFTYNDGDYDTVGILGSQYGVSLGGVISSSPDIGLVLHDTVLQQGYAIETEPFIQTTTDGTRRRVCSTIDIAKIYELATRRPFKRELNSTDSPGSYFVEAHMTDQQADEAAKKGMTPSQLAIFGFSSLMTLAKIHQDTPFISSLYIINRSKQYRGELQLQKQRNADRLHLRSSHTGIMGRMVLAVKTGQ